VIAMEVTFGVTRTAQRRRRRASRELCARAGRDMLCYVKEGDTQTGEWREREREREQESERRERKERAIGEWRGEERGGQRRARVAWTQHLHLCTGHL